MYSERMMQTRLKKIKKELEEHFNKRNEYILDKIFQGNIIILGPEDLIKHLTEVKNLKIEAVRFEGKLTGYMFKDGKEFHTLYLAEKNEDLKKFLIDVSKNTDISPDTFVGFSIFNDKDADTGNYGILAYDLKDNEFSKDNVKKAIEKVLPTTDDMFNSTVKDSVQEFTEKIMLTELMNITAKNKKKVAK